MMQVMCMRLSTDVVDKDKSVTFAIIKSIVCIWLE